MTAVEVVARVAADDVTMASRPSRLRSWIVDAVRDVGYAGGVFAWSIAGFSILVTGVSVTVSLLVLVVGVPLWIGFAHVLRWTTWVDRRFASWQRREQVPAVYRRSSERGFVAYLRTLTTDPQTWKDMAWLAVNSFVGFAYGLVVVTAAGLVVTYVTMPAWFWAVSHPHSEYGVTNLGFLTVDTWGEALTASAIGLVLLPIVLILARAGARMHSGLAVRMLGAEGSHA